MPGDYIVLSIVVVSEGNIVLPNSVSIAFTSHTTGLIDMVSNYNSF